LSQIFPIMTLQTCQRRKYSNNIVDTVNTFAMLFWLSHHS